MTSPAAGVPKIYVNVHARARVGLAGRALALTIAIVSLGLLVTAARLSPSVSGVGTHTQLGLASCQFLDRTGIPCAGCGMTTSFAWLTHGHPLRSFTTQPSGFVLGVSTAAAFWAGLYVATTGRAAHRLLLMIPAGYIIAFTISVVLFGWAWKIVEVVGMSGG